MICSGVVQTKQAHIGPSGIVGFRGSRFSDFGLEGLGIPGYLVRGLRLESLGIKAAFGAFAHAQVHRSNTQG